MPDFTAITEAVIADIVRDDIVDVPSQIAAAFRWRQANLLENTATWTDNDVGGAGDVLAVVDSIRTKVQSHALCVKAVVKVVEDLVEVIGAKKELISHLGAKRGI